MQARFVGWLLILLGCVSVVWVATAGAADWPTWRANVHRTAVTADDLPDELHLSWTLDNPQLSPAWAEDPRLYFDAAYEPIVVGGKMFVSSSYNDSVSAYETATGELLWRFYADGPVRFAPTAHEGRLYFGADDGCVYCVDADQGKLLWRVSLAPNERQVLGNERLISVWPVRGGVVVAGDQLHVTSGVWPFEGTFLHSVDLAAVGELGSDADENARLVESALRKVVLPTDLSPQGYLVENEGRIFIPCGRSNAACFDLASGRFLNVRYDSKGKTDYHVSALGPWLLHGEKIVHIEGQRMGQVAAPRPIVTSEQAYFPMDGAIKAYDLSSPEILVGKDRRGRPVESLKLAEAWSLANDQFVNNVPGDQYEYEIWLRENPLHVDLLSGSRLFGHQANQVFAIDLPTDTSGPSGSWRVEVDGTPWSIVAGDDRLFVSTREGKIHCYSQEKPAEPSVAGDTPRGSAVEPTTDERAGKILSAVPAAGGYALVWGGGAGTLLDALVDQSELQWIAVEPDVATVDELRRRLDGQGRYGVRAVAVAGDPLKVEFPPYLATLVVVEDAEAMGFGQPEPFVQRLFRVLRPYGGTACLVLDDAQHEIFVKAAEEATLPNGTVTRRDGLTLLTREGALPGSADWTHEYGDATNSLMSQDNLVKAPLGLLWFGGPSSDNRLYFDRHDWGPSMAVVEGRIFIQGPEIFSAVDVYTGRMLWQMPIRDGQGNGRRGNFMTAGYHFVVVPDGVYLAYNDVCLWLDPATGKQLGEFRLPAEGGEWGNFRVYDNLLITAVFRKQDKETVPAGLIALDRKTGEKVWSRDAEFAFPFFAVGAGKVFCVDGMLERLYQDMRRRGLVPKSASNRTLIALKAETGEPIWTQPLDLVATWLGYSEDRDVLIASNKQGIIGLLGSSGQVLWERHDEAEGFGGHPESVWDKVILAGDRVIDQRGPGMAYFIETGEPVTEPHPVTGESVPWKFNRQGHHCNYAIANPHLITFRAADAGFCDLSSSGSSRLYGFRSGCRNSLLPAGGVLNAPNFASGCVCGYSLFTSLSLVHVPEADMWQYAAIEASDLPVARVGINLGAPGSRRDPEGSLWLDYPRSSTTPLDLPVELKGESLDWFRQHVSNYAEASLPWVAASGVEGATSLTIDLGKDIRDQRPYTVRLYLADPHPEAAAERIFDVALQGVLVRENVDLLAEVKAGQGVLVVEIPQVQVASLLTVELIPKTGRTVLCGVEAIAERP